VHGYPFSCVCIGISIGENPVAGVVHTPAANETFKAVIGQGAYLNGKKISVSNVRGLNFAALATEFGYARDPNDVDIVLKRIRNILLAKTQTIRCAGSAALNMCNVAAGRLDIYYEGIDVKQGPKPWDVMAAGIIVREAGGCLRDLDGSDFNPCCGRILAANSKELADELVRVLNQN
jgi:fructose-1,6-bisphosphatase/inositol monophosphatase family enzyme